MRVLLRNAETGRFFAGADRWEASPVLAFDFLTVETAARQGRAVTSARMEIVLSYEEPPCELVFPVGSES
jgi:hypothetical protein